MHAPRRLFFFRADHNPAWQGLRGLAMLYFFQLTFLDQFDPAKLSRISVGHPQVQAVVELVNLLLAPAAACPEVMFVLAGYLLGRATQRAVRFRDFAFARVERLYPCYLVVMLPLLSYLAAGPAEALRTLALASNLGDMLKFTWMIGAVFWFCLAWVLSGAAGAVGRGFWVRLAAFWGLMAAGAAYTGHAAVTVQALGLPVGLAAWRLRERLPAWLLSLPGLCLLVFLVLAWPAAQDHLAWLALPRQAALTLAVAGLGASTGWTARLLSLPLLRYFGITAYSFLLVHATWGLRLSRSMIHSQMDSLATILVHYALSLALSGLFAGVLYVFLERPHFLRKAKPAGNEPLTALQGASPWK
jgi:peptidoglycan/LPS O-acetylase OafA/YrhL